MDESSFSLPLSVSPGLSINFLSISIGSAWLQSGLFDVVHSTVHPQDPLSGLLMCPTEVCFPRGVLGNHCTTTA